MSCTGSDAHALLRQVMLVIWREEVLSRFDAAHAVTCNGLPRTA